MNFVESKEAGDLCEKMVAQYLIALDDTIGLERSQ
jgi:hypothetical protein